MTFVPLEDEGNAKDSLLVEKESLTEYLFSCDRNLCNSELTLCVSLISVSLKLKDLSFVVSQESLREFLPNNVALARLITICFPGMKI